MWPQLYRHTKRHTLVPFLLDEDVHPAKHGLQKFFIPSTHTGENLGEQSQPEEQLQGKILLDILTSTAKLISSNFKPLFHGFSPI